MGLWNSKGISKAAKKDFEKAWNDTKDLLPKTDFSKNYHLNVMGYGRPHIIFETIESLRQAYLKLGFDEAMNPIFIEDKQVIRQFGPEAYAVLDRCYYLGGLPRPDVGLGEDKIAQIKNFGVENIDKEGLQELLHKYKKGEFGGDDLIYKIAEAMHIEDSVATKIVDKVFPEFKELKPEAGNVTLRSHMTSGWFLTLENYINTKPLPLRLFCIDRAFRREQTEDETHLRSHHSASCIMAGEDITVEDGKRVSEGLLSQFGFEKFEFRPDEKRSKYYTPDTQTEVYAFHKDTGWVEIATFGIYSPVALSKYKIEYPVMNLGLGVERLAMVLMGHKDVRAMVYPQFYEEWKLSDKDIASMLIIKNSPLTAAGREISSSIIRIAREKGQEESPCEFEVYSGELLGKKVTVKMVEREENAKLLGPAAFNIITISNGNISGIEPGGEKSEDVLDLGVNYMDAIAPHGASKVEQGILAGKTEFKVRVPMVKSLGDINLQLKDAGQRYITTYSKKIDIRGPVFLTLEVQVI